MVTVVHNLRSAFTSKMPSKQPPLQPHLGSSDHLPVTLISTYKPLADHRKATVNQVKVWAEGAMEAPQDC